jgi:hypothetical protein
MIFSSCNSDINTTENHHDNLRYLLIFRKNWADYGEIMLLS